jgi:hypothetical protein
MSDNLGRFDSSTPGVAAVIASASGSSSGSNGVHCMTSSDSDSALYGEHLGSGIGVFGRGGQTAGGWGVFGQTNSSASGVYGKNTSNGVGVVGESAGGTGVLGVGQPAGRFEGNVEVTGDLLLTGYIQVQGVRFPDGSVQQTGGGVTYALVHVSNTKLSGNWDGQHWDPQQARCSNNFDSGQIPAGGIIWQVEGVANPDSVIFDVSYAIPGPSPGVAGPDDFAVFSGVRNHVQTSPAVGPQYPMYISKVNGAFQPFMLRIMYR